MKEKKSIEKTLKSIRISRIVLPIFIGIGVVLYLLWIHFDIEEFQKIEWGPWFIGWILLGIFFYVLRHLAYAYRLMSLSDGELSFLKAVELIFIWEFSTTVSPTSLGGSALAMVFLSFEKIRTAKAVTIVLYTIVLDTLFFITSIPLLILILGPRVIRPELDSLIQADGFALTFIIVYIAMLSYGLFFYLGLFHRPDLIKRFLDFIAAWAILKRFRFRIEDTGRKIESSSLRLKGKTSLFHIRAIIATFLAWIFKFSLMFCVIYAIVETLPRSAYNTLMIYGRFETMFLITAASPTPGGSGLAEYLFGGFYSDYVPISLAVIIAFIWRLIAYYSYLFAGAIIVPAWLRKIYKRKKSYTFES